MTAFVRGGDVGKTNSLTETKFLLKPRSLVTAILWLPLFFFYVRSMLLMYDRWPEDSIDSTIFIYL